MRENFAATACIAHPLRRMSDAKAIGDFLGNSAQEATVKIATQELKDSRTQEEPRTSCRGPHRSLLILEYSSP
jgi:hypothetical protein